MKSEFKERIEIKKTPENPADKLEKVEKKRLQKTQLIS